MRHTIELIHHRSSDYGCDLYLFIDGQRRDDFTVYDIDSGVGWQLSDWNETTDAECQRCSPQVEPLLRNLRDSEVEYSKYIIPDEND